MLIKAVALVAGVYFSQRVLSKPDQRVEEKLRCIQRAIWLTLKIGFNAELPVAIPICIGLDRAYWVTILRAPRFKTFRRWIDSLFRLPIGNPI